MKARPRIHLPSFALVALLALAAAPAAAPGAGDARTFDPVPGVISAPPPGAAPLEDRILGAGERTPVLRRARENRYVTAAGEVVFVTVSDLYAPDPASDQALVDFLAGLAHGKELDGFRVYVAHPLEMSSVCGARAAACYHPGQERMYIVGEDSFGGLPTDYVAAHEYGHHIANNRTNPPFPGSALYWGTKRWATEQRVCPATAAGRLHPGDQGRHYYENPGEAYAEEYALRHYPGLLPWEYTPFLKPDKRSTKLLLADVRRPWTKNDRVRKRIRLGAGETERLSLRTRLDGRLEVKLKGPRGENFDLVLRHRDRVVERSASSDARESLRHLVCGESKFRIAVKAVDGSGAAKVSISKP